MRNRLGIGGFAIEACSREMTPQDGGMEGNEDAHRKPVGGFEPPGLGCRFEGCQKSERGRCQTAIRGPSTASARWGVGVPMRVAGSQTPVRMTTFFRSQAWRGRRSAVAIRHHAKRLRSVLQGNGFADFEDENYDENYDEGRGRCGPADHKPPTSANQRAPNPKTTTGTVRRRISRSSQSDQLSM